MAITPLSFALLATCVVILSVAVYEAIIIRRKTKFGLELQEELRKLRKCPNHWSES